MNFRAEHGSPRRKEPEAGCERGYVVAGDRTYPQKLLCPKSILKSPMRTALKTRTILKAGR
jgi:hypothetical protein